MSRYHDDNSPSVTPGGILALTAAGLGCLVLVIAVIVGIIAGAKSFGRHQAIADANNRAHVARINAANEQQVNKLRINAQAQKVQIAKQSAQIRLENAKGVREAQDEISRTLTPLYVQFEMTQALEDVAKSGKNATVVFVPSGAGGIPLVAGADGQPRVTLPGGAK